MILFYPHPALKTVCEPVTKFDAEIKRDIEYMRKGMEFSRVEAMGIAANQVGIFKRLFIMESFVIINPELTGFSEEQANLKEGCLSTPGVYEVIPERYSEIEIKFQDENGKEHKKQFSKIHAVCIQHEMDHLDGIFWFEKLSNSGKRRVRKLNKRWSQEKF